MEKWAEECWSEVLIPSLNSDFYFLKDSFIRVLAAAEEEENKTKKKYRQLSFCVYCKSHSAQSRIFPASSHNSHWDGCYSILQLKYFWNCGAFAFIARHCVVSVYSLCSWRRVPTESLSDSLRMHFIVHQTSRNQTQFPKWPQPSGVLSLSLSGEDKKNKTQIQTHNALMGALKPDTNILKSGICAESAGWRWRYYYHHHRRRLNARSWEKTFPQK